MINEKGEMIKRTENESECEVVASPTNSGRKIRAIQYGGQLVFLPL